MFGIAWGVGSLLVLVGLGEGFRSGQHSKLATFGNDVVMMWNGTIPALANQHTGMRPYQFTLGDEAALRRLPQLRAVTAELAPHRSLRSQPVDQYLRPRDGSRTQLRRGPLRSPGPGPLSRRCRPGRTPPRRGAGFQERHPAVSRPAHAGRDHHHQRTSHSPSSAGRDRSAAATTTATTRRSTFPSPPCRNSSP